MSNLQSIESTGFGPRLLLRRKELLGESPVWDADRSELLWIDILRMQIFAWRRHPRAVVRSWKMPELVGFIALQGDGALLVGLASGLYRLCRQTGALALQTPIAHDTASHRINDGAVDPRGRIWFGSTDEAGSVPGKLYRVDADGGISVHGDDWLCPNGIGWSPDQRTMYATDTKKRVIWAYDYDVATGTPSAKRHFHAPERGLPDGLAVDLDGFVWSACWDGGCLLRLTPAGQVDRIVPMPVRRPTSLAFGGDDRRTLFVTSASLNLEADDDEPAGAIFDIRVDVPGIPVPLARLDPAGVPA